MSPKTRPIATPTSLLLSPTGSVVLLVDVVGTDVAGLDSDVTGLGSGVIELGSGLIRLGSGMIELGSGVIELGSGDETGTVDATGSGVSGWDVTGLVVV